MFSIPFAIRNPSPCAKFQLTNQAWFLHYFYYKHAHIYKHNSFSYTYLCTNVTKGTDSYSSKATRSYLPVNSNLYTYGHCNTENKLDA